MPPDDQGERTEAPTPRKLQEARQRGQVARSTELSSTLTLLGILMALHFVGPRLFGQMASMMRLLLDVQEGAQWELASVDKTLRTCGWSLAMMLGPLLLTVMLVAVLSNLMQVGILFTAEPLKPSLNKINPLSGLQRLFSKRSLMRLAMSLGKVAVIGVVGYLTIANRMDSLMMTAGLGYQQIVAVAAEMVFALTVRVAIILLALSILDYMYQRWQHEQDLKMTKQEMKEDLKRMEGDPMIRARRQRVARQLAMQRMSQEVPKASVIVTNPTHLAVALLYKEGMNAPKVVAKGADYMALRIRQIAAANGVPIVERKPLARALFKSSEVGDEIPVSLYQAVAEVLAYVYELSRQKKIGRRIPAGV